MAKPSAAAEAGFRSVKRAGLPDAALSEIKRMIVEGQLVAGERLPAERDLALTLGVSRPALREAISALIALNILESRQGQGTFVSSLEPELLAEPIDFLLRINESAIHALFEARRALESETAALASVRATDEELAGMAELVAGGREKLDDVMAFVEHDIEFHRRIWRAARSSILASLLQSVGTLSRASRMQTGQALETRKKTVADHEAILRALQARDPVAARRCMVDHLQHVEAALDDEGSKQHGD
jgi:GntR family transcriptional repressor for pyruvate dehydrogenase complex